MFDPSGLVRDHVSEESDPHGTLTALAGAVATVSRAHRDMRTQLSLKVGQGNAIRLHDGSENEPALTAA